MSNYFSRMLVGDDFLSIKLLQPLVNFAARFYVAYVFFKSGIGKVDNNFKVTPETVALFRDEFKVPFIPPEIAANITAYAEIFLPILLLIGFLTRPAAKALFILNAIAFYSLHTADWANPVANSLHVFWGAVLLAIFAYGPSKVSVDSWINKKMAGQKSSLILKILAIIVLSAIAYFLLNKYTNI